VPILWQNRSPVRVPELVHTLLPPYEIPDLIVVGALVVENRGRAPAHNIKVVLEYENSTVSKIRHLQVTGDVDYILRSGGDMQSFATLRLARLGPGQKMVIYFSGPDHVQPRVTVTHYEG
jgi:hypothetical protein